MFWCLEDFTVLTIILASFSMLLFTYIQDIHAQTMLTTACIMHNYTKLRGTLTMVLDKLTASIDNHSVSNCIIHYAHGLFLSLCLDLIDRQKNY